MVTPSKTTRKATAKKAAAKNQPKKTVSVSKSSAVKAARPKSRARKAVAGKAAPKKAAPKKAAPKKAAPKKAAPKKAAPKKAAAKKAAPKKAAVKKPPVKKSKGPKVIKSRLAKKFVDEMKARLLEERAKYLQTAEDMRAEADSLFADREPGDVQFDEESGEGDTLAVERERGLALSSQATSAVQQIDEALDRIKAGTYGICVSSGLPIPKERLDAIPWAAMRVEYKVGGLSRR